MKRIYLAGLMTGKPALNFKEFFKWQLYWEQQGYEVVNPAEKDVTITIIDKHHRSWEECLAYDIELMSTCTHAFFMSGYHKSRGAHVEHAFANKSKVIECVYEDELVEDGEEPLTISI